MQLSEYQKKTTEFAKFPRTIANVELAEGKIKGLTVMDWTYPVMGLTEEAGEVAGKFAKAVRDENGMITEERKNEIIKELGDVYWMLSEICNCLGINSEEVLDKNIEKLSSRKDRGVLSGSGDNR